MARFLNTSATNYFLEDLIKGTQERLVIISPFLRFNDRIKELITDKDRMKIDVRLVYGKSDLAPAEVNWLKSLEFVRTSFCQNLHAKCYLNEKAAIITSMNLYEFSQVNNNEMGVYILRDEEPDLYRDTYDEAARLIRVSEQVRLSVDKVEESSPSRENNSSDEEERSTDKLTTSRLAKSLGWRTSELNDRLIAKGFLVAEAGQLKLTDDGKKAGGEFRFSKKFGPYFLWPGDLPL